MAIEYRLPYTGEELSEKLNTISSNKTAINVVTTNVNEHINNDDIHLFASEREKLSGIENNANYYTLPSAGTSLGGVRSGGDVTITEGVITLKENGHTHTISNVDGLQSILDNKSETSHNHDSKYDVKGSAESVLKSAKEYIDTEIAELIGTSPEDADTLGELYDLISEYGDISEDFIEELFVSTESGEVINTISPISDELIDQIWDLI